MRRRRSARAVPVLRVANVNRHAICKCSAPPITLYKHDNVEICIMELESIRMWLEAIDEHWTNIRQSAQADILRFTALNHRPLE